MLMEARTYLMRWNPAISSFTEKDYEECVANMEHGMFRLNWSIYEWQEARRGDFFYMLRTGDDKAGIVFSGQFLSLRSQTLKPADFQQVFVFLRKLVPPSSPPSIKSIFYIYLIHESYVIIENLVKMTLFAIFSLSFLIYMRCSKLSLHC